MSGTWGRSPELLDHWRYGSVVRRHLLNASHVCSDVIGRRVNLVQRVKDRRETTLRSYAEALALIVAMEQAQLELLREFFDVDYAYAAFSFGYSLGEVSALIAGGVFEMEHALRIPVSLAADAVELAHDATLGVLFSRAESISLEEVQRLCVHVTAEGKGTIDISAILTPNSMLLIGQGETLRRFQERMSDELSVRTTLRRNEHRWPPIHTAITWQRAIPNRCGVMLEAIPGGFQPPRPNVVSLVTGEFSYDSVNARETLRRWTDHPQRLWDVVYHTLAADVDVLLHVGPAPNIIPATFKRLKENVEMQTQSKAYLRALSVAHPWLKAILPKRTALLRAPKLQHVILEDWLLENSP